MGLGASSVRQHNSNASSSESSMICRVIEGVSDGEDILFYTHLINFNPTRAAADNGNLIGVHFRKIEIGLAHMFACHCKEKLVIFFYNICWQNDRFGIRREPMQLCLLGKEVKEEIWMERVWIIPCISSGAALQNIIQV